MKITDFTQFKILNCQLLTRSIENTEREYEYKGNINCIIQDTSASNDNYQISHEAMIFVDKFQYDSLINNAENYAKIGDVLKINNIRCEVYNVEITNELAHIESYYRLHCNKNYL